MERILVVDDGRENREFIAEYILEPNGYEPLMAKDGKEGLDMALAEKPDLILLDYQLPRMNGVEVLEALVERGMNIPVILMTFYGSEEIAIEVYRLGVRDYLKKPFSVEEMLLAIERSLGDGRLRREKEALTERLIQSNRELQMRLQELNVLYSVGKSVTSLTDLEQLLPRIVDAAIKVSGAEEGQLYLVENGALVCRALKRHNTARAGSVNQRVNDPVAQHVAQTGQPLILTPEPTNPASAAAVPLVMHGEVVGVLSVSNLSSDARAFGKHDSAILSALTDYAAIAIENSRGAGQPEALPTPRAERKAPATRRQEIGVLFADIRGYSADEMSVDAVTDMLDEYLNLSANVIELHGGTLDPYLSDGWMAIFDSPDPARQAVAAALDLQQAVSELESARGDGLAVGVGIGVGEAVVGSFADRYTAVGEVVSLTRKLQEHAQPGQILIDEGVVSRLQGMVQARAIGELRLKGQQKHARVYALEALVQA